MLSSARKPTITPHKIWNEKNMKWKKERDALEATGWILGEFAAFKSAQLTSGVNWNYFVFSVKKEHLNVPLSNFSDECFFFGYKEMNLAHFEAMYVWFVLLYVYHLPMLNNDKWCIYSLLCSSLRFGFLKRREQLMWRKRLDEEAQMMELSALDSNRLNTTRTTLCNREYTLGEFDAIQSVCECVRERVINLMLHYRCRVSFLFSKNCMQTMNTRKPIWGILNAT